MITLFPTHESSFFGTLGGGLISGVLLLITHMGKLSSRRRGPLPKVFERGKGSPRAPGFQDVLVMITDPDKNNLLGS